MKHLSNRSITLLLSLLLLQGCGGGGGDSDSDSPSSSNSTTYTGSTAEATIDASNAKEIATGAASGTQEAVASNALSVVAMRPQATPRSKLEELSPRIAQWIDQLMSPHAAKVFDVSNDICDQGGSAVADTNDDETEGTITFNNCTINDMEGGSMVLNGAVRYSANISADTLSMVYDVTVDYIGESQAINMSLACNDISTPAISCSITSDFEGTDGKVYRMEDITVSGSVSSGFYIGMTFYDPHHGWVDVTTTQPLTYACDKDVPGSGMFSMNGAGGTSATVSFDSCSAYTVTVNGVGTSYDW
jgi:hypothetical protein